MKTITVQRFFCADGGAGKPQFAVRLWKDEQEPRWPQKLLLERWFEDQEKAADYAKDLSRCYGGMLACD